MFHVYALRNAGRFDDALAAAKKNAKRRQRPPPRVACSR